MKLSKRTAQSNPSNNLLSSNNLFGIVAIAAMLGLSACQSTPTSSPVMQRANSTFETTGIGPTKVVAQQNAMQSASVTCGRRNTIVITDEVVFNGVVDARTGRMIDQVGSVIGAVLGTNTPNLARDDDYEYKITFRCE